MKINESDVAYVPTSTPADSVPQLTATDCTACGDSWERFRRTYSHWFEAREKEGTVVYSCPVDMTDHRLMSLFQLDDEALAAEQAYSQLCGRCHAVAIYEHQPLVYRWLDPRLAAPEEHWLEDMKTHGWTDEHIGQMNELVGKTNDIAERLMGSLGRLVCSPAFCAERESLRRQWDSLSSLSRPNLPLYRSIRAPRGIDGLDEVALTSEQSDFAKAFDRFCDT